MYHDTLFADQEHHEEVDFVRIAREVGMDVQAFMTCYQSGRYRDQVNQDITDGLRAGVQGTPTFFFNGLRVEGALDRSMLETIIQEFVQAKAS